MTCVTLHVTFDTWHMTHDAQGVVNIVSKCQVPSSYGLCETVFSQRMTESVSELISDKCVCWHDICFIYLCIYINQTCKIYIWFPLFFCLDFKRQITCYMACTRNKHIFILPYTLSFYLHLIWTGVIAYTLYTLNICILRVNNYTGTSIPLIFL